MTLSRPQIKVLAASAQPIFLVGLSRYARRAVTSAVVQAMAGIDLDAAAPDADLSILVPPMREDGNQGRTIGIDAVKLLVDRLCLTPYAHPVRVGLIEPASALTLESQNALLRYIEEPTPTSRIILSSRRSEDLIPTLLSRCQIIRIPGRAGEDGESAAVAEQYGEPEKNVATFYEILDDPDAVEKLLEFRLGKHALELYAVVKDGRLPDPQLIRPFMEKRIPATESSFLFVEIVFSAVCARLAGLPLERSRPALELAGHLLVLQMELRYNPGKLLIQAAVLEWLKACQTQETAAVGGSHR